MSVVRDDQIGKGEMRNDGVFGGEDAGKWNYWNIGSMIEVMGEFRETGG